MLRTLFAALMLASVVVVPAPEASAEEVSLLFGVGPRFDIESGDANAVSVIHLDYEVISMLRLSAQLHGYVGGPGLPDGVGFGDVQIGALFDVPIPGWFGIEAGAYVGVSNLISGRHGDSGLIGIVRPEVALTATFSPFKGRLSYQHNLLPLGDTKDVKLSDGQLTFMAGFVF